MKSWNLLSDFDSLGCWEQDLLYLYLRICYRGFACLFYISLWLWMPSLGWVRWLSQLGDTGSLLVLKFGFRFPGMLWFQDWSFGLVRSLVIDFCGSSGSGEGGFGDLDSICTWDMSLSGIEDALFKEEDGRGEGKVSQQDWGGKVLKGKAVLERRKPEVVTVPQADRWGWAGKWVRVFPLYHSSSLAHRIYLAFETVFVFMAESINLRLFDTSVFQMPSFPVKNLLRGELAFPFLSVGKTPGP